MDSDSLPYRSAAVLVWLPEGESPPEVSLDIARLKGPPDPNPQAWWQFGEAVTHAVSAMARGENGDKLPWIKVGVMLYDLDRIRVAHRAIVQAQTKSVSSPGVTLRGAQEGKAFG